MVKYYLSRLIERAHETEGFISAFIYGSQGTGKTSYSLHVAADVYGCWNTALKHLFFSPLDAIDKMLKTLERLEAGEGERIKVLIMDDAGIWLSKSTWWEDSKQEFAELFDLIRSVCSCVIFNSPGNNVIGRIMNEIMLRVKITEIDAKMSEMLRDMGYKIDSTKYRLAVLYSHKLTPKFQGYIKKEAYDVFPLHYPVYEEYNRIRLKVVKQKLINVKQVLETKRKERMIVEGQINENLLDEQIVELLKLGLPKHRIAKILGISSRTLYDKLKKLRINSLQ